MVEEATRFTLLNYWALDIFSIVSRLPLEALSIELSQ